VARGGTGEAGVPATGCQPRGRPTLGRARRGPVAERYYKKVYDAAGSRELKAQAAWLAAKAELGTLIYKEQNAHPNDFVDAGKMIPKTWFSIFKRFSNTKYYKEVLAECGRFRNWVGGN
jgi:hypothetical protein